LDPKNQTSNVLGEFHSMRKSPSCEAECMSIYSPVPSYIRNSWNPNAIALLESRQAAILVGSNRFSYCSDMNMNGVYEKNHSTAAIRDAVLAVTQIHKNICQLNKLHVISLVLWFFIPHKTRIGKCTLQNSNKKVLHLHMMHVCCLGTYVIY